MKKIIALLLALSMIVCLLAGCGSDTKEPANDDQQVQSSTKAAEEPVQGEQEEQRTYKIGFSNVWVGNTYGIQCVNELETFLKNNEKVSEYYIYNADNDVNKQISDIEDLIAKGVDMCSMYICVAARAPCGMKSSGLLP